MPKKRKLNKADARIDLMELHGCSGDASGAVESGVDKRAINFGTRGRMKAILILETALD